MMQGTYEVGSELDTAHRTLMTDHSLKHLEENTGKILTKADQWRHRKAHKNEHNRIDDGVSDDPDGANGKV